MKKSVNGVKFTNEVDEIFIKDFQSGMKIKQLAEKYQEKENYIERRIEFLSALNHRTI